MFTFIETIISVCIGYALGYFAGFSDRNMSIKFDFRKYRLIRSRTNDEEKKESKKCDESDESDKSDEFTGVVESDSQQPTHMSDFNVEDNELEAIFAEEEINNAEDVLSKGPKIGSEPISYLTTGNSESKYATNTKLKEIGDKYRNFKKLTKKEEIEILSSFQSLTGYLLSDAMKYAAKKTYELHPIGVIMEDGEVKYIYGQSCVYNAAKIAVIIRDPNYNIIENKPSKSAIVSEFVKVGDMTPPQH